MLHPPEHFEFPEVDKHLELTLGARICLGSVQVQVGMQVMRKNENAWHLVRLWQWNLEKHNYTRDACSTLQPMLCSRDERRDTSTRTRYDHIPATGAGAL